MQSYRPLCIELLRKETSKHSEACRSPQELTMNESLARTTRNLKASTLTLSVTLGFDPCVKIERNSPPRSNPNVLNFMLHSHWREECP